MKSPSLTRKIDTSVDIMHKPTRGQILSALVKGYGITGAMSLSDTMRARVMKVLEQYRTAALMGRVIDVGTMDYTESREVAETGATMAASGLVQHPFSSAWCVIGNMSFMKDGDPQPTIVFILPDAENGGFVFSEATVTVSGDIAVWYLARMTDAGRIEVIYDPFYDQRTGGIAASLEHAIDPEMSLKIAYAVSVNACFVGISVCNTRGVPYKRRKGERKTNGKAKKAGTVKFDTKSYFTALKDKRSSSAGSRHGGGGGTHASPRAHVRRGHVRHNKDGSVSWVRECLVGARTDDILAFVEGRIAYVR